VPKGIEFTAKGEGNKGDQQVAGDIVYGEFYIGRRLNILRCSARQSEIDCDEESCCDEVDEPIALSIKTLGFRKYSCAEIERNADASA